MPTQPKSKKLAANTVDILNVIRNNATHNYRDYVPEATEDIDSIRAIGNIIMSMPNLQNEFLSALVNRIAMVIITSKSYENPWRFFKKGLLEYGETVEDVFVNLAKVHSFDQHTAESEVFKREKPDVRTAFHTMNYQKFYKVTVSDRELRQAFLSLDGVTDLIAKIVESVYTSANYDEFLVMKYMLAQAILDGRLYVEEIAQVSAANMKSIASTLKSVSNKLEFMSNKYNIAGVMTHATKANQYLLVDADFDATMDVEVLASAFNMTKAEFLGNRVLCDSFGDLDTDRLAEIFADDDTYVELTDAQIAALKAIPAVLVDNNFFMIFDNMFEFTENYNGEGLYWNYFYHTWKTFSMSPFANSIVFVAGEPSITSVTVSPATATSGKGQKLNLDAVVVTANFAPQSVVWTVDSTAKAAGVTINIYGELSIPADADVASITVTATSTYDSTKAGTATITVA